MFRFGDGGDRAPRTFEWLGAVRDRREPDGDGSLEITDALEPLLTIVGATFVPLMEQNDRA